MESKFIPYYKDLTAKARDLRKSMTRAEKIIWYDFLRKKRKNGRD